MNNELSLMRRQIKDQIQLLINNNNLEEANTLLNEYFIMTTDDLEAYSMKAVLLIIQQNFIEAEKILAEGLNIDPSDKDLLLNMSYLMDITQRNKDALQYFSRAKLFHPYSDIRLEDTIRNLNEIDNNNLRVVHGTMEIANQMHTICKGLNNLGVKAQTLNYYPNYLGYKSDYTLNLNSFKNINEANHETKILASRVIEENDVFHFHFGTSLTLDYSDLSVLKELGKKVIMQHWGSDVRIYSKAVKRSPNIKVKQLDENKIKAQLDFLSKIISHCAVCDYELYEYVKDYYTNIHLIPQCIDLRNFKLHDNNNKKLLIVHAPTNREIKGTDYIVKAIENLKLSYDFEFILIENMSYEEAMRTYKQADIVIDQLLIGSYGLVAIENMALGKPVVCFINEYMKEKYPTDLPIILAGVDNIKEKIEYLIENQDGIKEIGLKGRSYVEKYHDVNVLNSKIIEIYKKINGGERYD